MYFKLIYFAIISYFANADKSVINNFQSIKQNLSTYSTNLLNETVLEFLNLCYSPHCCSENDQVLCPSYFELVKRLKINNVNVKLTNQQLKEIGKSYFVELTKINASEKGKLESDAEIKEFCKIFPNYMPDKSDYGSIRSQNEIIKVLKDSNSCRLLCSNINWDTENSTKLTHSIKPICNYISWLFAQLSANTKQPLLVSEVIVNKTEDNIKNNKKKENIILNTTNISEILLKNDQKTSVIKKLHSLNLVDNKKNITKNNNIIESKNLEVEEPSNNSLETKINKKQFEIYNNNPIGENENLKSSTNKNLEIFNNDQQKRGKLISVLEKKEQNQKLTTENQNEIEGKSQNQQKKQKQQEQEQGLSNDLYGNQRDDDNTEDLKSNENFLPDLLDSDVVEDGIGMNNNFKPDANNINNTPLQIKKSSNPSDPFYEEPESNFFTYFLIVMFICIIAYVLYYNKSKILGFIIEGRRSKKDKNRRKRLSGYRKLDTNLEEAITSGSNGKSTQIIY